MFRGMKWIKTATVDNYRADLFSQFEDGKYRVAFFNKDMVSTLALRHGISIVEALTRSSQGLQLAVTAAGHRLMVKFLACSCRE
jgi:hypothetical protein